VANNSPSLRPENNDSLTGTFNTVLNKYMQSIDGVMPAQVINFLPGPPDYVSVQPLISTVSTDMSATSRGQISNIPVCQIGGGGIVSRFNLIPGDQGLIIACDRDISLYMRNGLESQPNDYRIKDFSFSFFLPLVMRNYTVAPEDIQNAVLQNLSGTVRLSLFPDKIKVTGDAEFVNNVTINGRLTVTGRTIVYGDINCGGDITAVGTITPGTPIPP
jgi:hypothetical protein